MTSGAAVLLVSGLSACAVAYAQTPPPASPAPAVDAATAVAVTDAAAAVDSAATGPAVPPPAYTGPPPYYFVRPPRTSAGLAPDSVHRVFMRAPNQQAIVTCYTNLLAANPRARAVVSVRLDVIAGGFGSIDTVRVAPANDPLRDCVRAALGRFEWPNPSGNAPSSHVDAQIDLAPTPPPTTARGH
ncbi:MAG: hypothetical protein WCJ30_24290 [Deltaproteobacteria bacterium]